MPDGAPSMECGVTVTAEELLAIYGADSDANCDPNALIYISVAIHFLLPEQPVSITIPDKCNGNALITYVGAGNFTETGDGFTNSGYNGFKRAEDVIDKANYELANNSDQRRKDPGQTYPATPPANPLRYLLVGVYFHRDDDAYNIDPDAGSVHSTYDVDGNNVLDIYYTPTVANYFGNATGTDGFATGGGALKYVFMGDYYRYVYANCRTWSLEFSAELLNHEIGHSLSLIHTWNAQDFCDDTPLGFVYDKWNASNSTCILNQYANCWKYDTSILTCPTSTEKPCDEWSKASNNIMDYNEYYPHAYTVCQIDRITADLNGAGSTYVASCNGCEPFNAFFYMRDEYKLCGSPIYLNGQPSVNETTYKIEICEVNPLSPNICIGSSYSSGWINGTVGSVDLSNLYNLSTERCYRVTLSVHNKIDCFNAHKYSKVICTKKCLEDVPEPVCCFDMVVQNPFEGDLQIFYKTPEDGQLTMQLVNLNSSSYTEVLPTTNMLTGEFALTQNTASLPPGTYALIANFNGTQYSKTILKQ